MVSTRTHNYDKDTGQAFDEWIEAPLNPSEVEWTEHQVLDPIQGRSGPGKKGPRALTEMAVKVAAENFNTIEDGGAQTVPNHLLRDIWNYSSQHHKIISLQAYIVLMKCLTKDQRKDPEPKPLDFKLFKARFMEARPVKPLAMYTKHIMSSSFEFIAHLNISGAHVSFGTHELLGLTQLKNLGVLEILQPGPLQEAPHFPRVTDSVIRQWSQETDPFPILRVLRIYGDYFTTTRSLQYLSKFPSLAMYEVAGRAADWDRPVSNSGWVLHKQATQHNKDNLEVSWGHWDEKCLRPTLEMAQTTPPSEVFNTWVTIKTTERDNTPDAEKPINCVDPKNMLLAETLDMIVFKDLDRHLRHDSYGYLSYCQLGRLCSDKDLIAQGIHDGTQVFLKDGIDVIPPRPYVSLRLGKCVQQGSDISNPIRHGAVFEADCIGTTRVFDRYRMFVRSGYNIKPRIEKPPKTQPDHDKKRPSKPEPSLKMRKKVKGFSMDDL